MAHQQLLSVPADLLVCLMTASRLQILRRIDQVGGGGANQPRPILGQVVAVYFVSFVLDSPNWMMFETKVTELLLLMAVMCWLQECTQSGIGNHTVLDEDCWSYAETKHVSSAEIWLIVIILQSVLAKIIPAISIVTMNLFIIIKLRRICRTKQQLTEKLRSRLELQTNLSEDFTITEKVPTGAFSWLKVPTSIFTFKTLCQMDVDPMVSKSEIGHFQL